MTSKTQDKETGRLLAIGDIHGCLQQLETLLEKVSPVQEDHVVFLGDYVDRGPDSFGVIEFLMAFEKHFPGTVFLRGNHEQMFTDYLAGRKISTFLLNGGTKTLESYRAKDSLPVPDSHLDFFNRLRNYYVIDQYIFVHAGLRPKIPLEQQDESDLLWIREDFISSDYDWGKTIVYGHTPRDDAHFSENRIGLDTGCVYGRKLTCCNVKTREIWQAGS